MRAPRYGELGVVNLPSEVKTIWHSRDEELPELPSWRWSFQHQADLQQVEDRGNGGRARLPVEGGGETDAPQPRARAANPQ